METCIRPFAACSWPMCSDLMTTSSRAGQAVTQSWYSLGMCSTEEMQRLVRVNNMALAIAATVVCCLGAHTGACCASPTPCMYGTLAALCTLLYLQAMIAVCLQLQAYTNSISSKV